MIDGATGHDVIPLVDLADVNAEYEEAYVHALRRVLRSSDFGVDGVVVEFEEELADFVGVDHAIGVNSGTAALQLLLTAAGIGPGDEVILPANTFFATAEAVVAAGARPVLVDPDLETALVPPHAVGPAIGPRTAAVIAVHLYGQPVDVCGYRREVAGRGIEIFEDAAQAIGAHVGGASAGSLAKAAGFSFYPAKNLGALGQGGAVTTDDDDIARQVRLLRSHGEGERYRHVRMGFNERLHGLQAAFLQAKLPNVGRDLARRERVVERYDRAVASIPGCDRIAVREHVRSAHHLYVVRVPERDRVLASLRRDGVMAAVHYPVPIHLQAAWAEFASDAAFPNAERLARESISLPLWPGMTDVQVDRCVDALTRAVVPYAADLDEVAS